MKKPFNPYFLHRLILQLIKSPRLCPHAYKNLQAKKNLLKDKTVFILGNGPSVRLEDLEKLKNETVIAVNRFHLCYDEITMRPLFTVVTDPLMIKQHGKEILEKCETSLFVPHYWPHEKNNTIPYYVKAKKIGFSESATRGVYSGYSVIIVAMQLAYFMGAKKIVLYGIDHSFDLPKNNSAHCPIKNHEAQNHFIKNYRDENETWAPPVTQVIDQSFLCAKKFLDKHQVEVVNSTRGGRLEVFLRCDLSRLK